MKGHNVTCGQSLGNTDWHFPFCPYMTVLHSNAKHCLVSVQHKTTLKKILCSKQTELKTVSIKKGHAWSHQHLWKPVYSVAWNLTGRWWMKCTTIKRSVWGKLETLCFLFHTRTQLTHIPHHKMQGCGNSALLTVWQKLKKKKKGYDKIRNRNLESLILCKLFCNTGIFFLPSVSWFGVVAVSLQK